MKNVSDCKNVQYKMNKLLETKRNQINCFILCFLSAPTNSFLIHGDRKKQSIFDDFLANFWVSKQKPC